MTDEEMAEEYAEKVVKHKMAVHDIFNEKVTKKEIKDAVIYGLKAGKEMAEADLATVAYMQGAERYKTKWHDLRKDPNVLPKLAKTEMSDYVITNKGVAYYNGRVKSWFIQDEYTLTDDVIAWCEIPKYTEE